MNGIENITKRISREASEEAKKIIAAAEAEAKEIRDEYIKKGEEKAEEILSRGKKTAEERASRLSGNADLEARKATLAKKQELISLAFSEAEKKLSSLSGSELSDVLAAFVLRAADGGKGEIILSASDRAAIGEDILKKCSENKGIFLSEETRELGGGVVFRDGISEVNCSFSALVASLRDDLSREVADILFG